MRWLMNQAVASIEAISSRGIPFFFVRVERSAMGGVPKGCLYDVCACPWWGLRGAGVVAQVCIARVAWWLWIRLSRGV